MAYNIADLYEHITDAVPDRIALVDRRSRQTFAQLDAASNRIAHALAERGVGPGDHVGVYAQNSHEWIETMLGCFKIRAVPINVNFRYVRDELSHIFNNAELAALVYDREYAPTVLEIRDTAPGLKVLLHCENPDSTIEDPAAVDAAIESLGSESFDDAVAEASDSREGLPEGRSGDDLYVLYTGGTTGLPKGVMWRQEDVYFALGQGIDAMTGERVDTEFTMAERAAAGGGGLVLLVIPPLMHGAAQWGTLGQMLQGNTIVLLPRFSARAVWELVDAESINTMVITGDAMGRPMIEELLANHDRYQATSLLALSSSAAVFSPTVKDQFLERFPNLVITDSIGSSEGGFNGLRVVGKDQAQVSAGGPTITPGSDVVLLDDDLALIPKDRVAVKGKIGRGGNIPLGYFNDEKKTAETFVVASDGNRYAVSGDWGQWEEGGLLTLLGRGSTTINSGGEKIHPEEVEAALKGHPAVFDCLVVGAPDERWGQTVTAIVQFRAGQEVGLTDLADHARKVVAGYKVPRRLHVVEEIVRSPSGKPDYPWANKLVREQTPAGD
ncbi:MAG: acyl-CoA synthetase [Microthrixaceae bacterium]